MATTFPTRTPAPPPGETTFRVPSRAAAVPPPPAFASRPEPARVTGAARASLLIPSRVTSDFEDGFDDAQASLSGDDLSEFVLRPSLGTRLRRVWLTLWHGVGGS